MKKPYAVTPGTSRPVAASATTAGLLAHRSKLPTLPSGPFRVQGSTSGAVDGPSGSPLTDAGAAADLPPVQRSSRDAWRSLFICSRGTIDA